MKKQLTLSNEETNLLYDLLLSFEVKTRSKSRKRFNFLNVIEEVAFDFQDKRDELTGNSKLDKKKLNKELEKLSEKKNIFVFDDLEVFSNAKDIFEKSFESGNKYRNGMGAIISSPLIGRAAKVYMQIENAFMEVKEIKDKK